MKNGIFTYYNLQIHPNIIECQKQVINKLIEGFDIQYYPMQYNAKDGEMFPDDCINQGVNELFYKGGYDNIFILDIDCIPLSKSAVKYTFERASQGYLIGNVQRSSYIENDNHLFVGSSCLCINKYTFEKIGRPNAAPTKRGDICEEWTYLAEEHDVPIEFYIPDSYEASPYGAENWTLSGDLKPYGIGTTFKNVMDNEMFYHLFESRTNLNVDRFVKKSVSILYP